MNAVLFWAKVNKSPGCWDWTAALDRKGYGRVGHKHGRAMFAHRAAWQFVHGPIPPGLHHCDNPRCVKIEGDERWPDGHLFLGTQADNVHDMLEKGRGWVQPGEANPKARLTNAQVREMRSRYPLGHGVRLATIAAEYGVSASGVCGILRGKTWLTVR